MREKQIWIGIGIILISFIFVNIHWTFSFLAPIGAIIFGAGILKEDALSEERNK